MKSIKYVLISVLAISLLASCSTIKNELGLSSDPGVTYNKKSVSEETLDADLKAIAKNKKLVDALKDSETPLVKDGKVTEIYRSSWANIQMQILAISEIREEKKIKITSKDKKDALALAKQVFAGSTDGGDDIWNAFSKSFRDRLVKGYSEQTALVRVLGKSSEKEIKAYYTENKATISKCDSGKTVSHILVATEKEAKDVKKKLDDGESFAKLAKSKSTDTGSKVKGGDLGCYTAGSYVESFENAVKSATMGKVSEPVKSDYGYHVILVKAFKAPTLEEARADIEAALSQQNQQKVSDEVTKSLKKAKVKVKKKYGKVIREDGVPSIVSNDTPKTTTTTTSPTS